MRCIHWWLHGLLHDTNRLPSLAWFPIYWCTHAHLHIGLAVNKRSGPKHMRNLHDVKQQSHCRDWAVHQTLHIALNHVKATTVHRSHLVETSGNSPPPLGCSRAAKRGTILPHKELTRKHSESGPAAAATALLLMTCLNLMPTTAANNTFSLREIP